MPKLKKTLLISLSSVLIIFFGLLFWLYFDFKTSVRYSTYQLALALKSQDSAKAMQYYNIDKIAENIIAKAEQEMQKEKDPSVVSLITNMLPRLKQTLPIQYKNTLIKEFETKNEKISQMSDFEILYLCLIDKPVLAPHQKTEKIDDNQIKQSFCNTDNNICVVKVWEKQNNIWQIVDVQQTKK